MIINSLFTIFLLSLCGLIFLGSVVYSCAAFKPKDKSTWLVSAFFLGIALIFLVIFTKLLLPIYFFEKYWQLPLILSILLTVSLAIFLAIYIKDRRRTKKSREARELRNQETHGSPKSI